MMSSFTLNTAGTIVFSDGTVSKIGSLAAVRLVVDHVFGTPQLELEYRSGARCR
jgi:hypothetical protein